MTHIIQPSFLSSYPVAEDGKITLTELREVKTDLENKVNTLKGTEKKEYKGRLEKITQLIIWLEDAGESEFLLAGYNTIPLQAIATPEGTVVQKSDPEDRSNLQHGQPVDSAYDCSEATPAGPQFVVFDHVEDGYIKASVTRDPKAVPASQLRGITQYFTERGGSVCLTNDIVKKQTD